MFAGVSLYIRSLIVSHSIRITNFGLSRSREKERNDNYNQLNGIWCTSNSTGGMLYLFLQKKENNRRRYSTFIL